MGINKQNENDDNLFISFIAVFKWVKVFLAPVFLFGLAGLAVLVNAESQFYEYIGTLIIGIGIIFGIFLAEYVRKHYGLIEFDARDEATPDIDEWLKKERDKLKNK